IAAARRALALNAVAPAEPLLVAALATVTADSADHLSLLGLLAHVRRFQGKNDDALQLLEHELLPHLAADAPDRAEHLVTRGVLYQLKGQYAEALPLLEEAGALAQARGDVAQALRARVYQGRVAFFAGEPGKAEALMAEAVALARRSEGGQVRYWLAFALGFLGYLLASGASGRVEDGLAMLDEAIAINQALGNPIAVAEALNNQGNVYMAAHRYAEARDVYARFLVLCGRIGPSNETVFAHIGAGTTALELGEPADAQRHADHAVQLAAALGRKFPQSYALAMGGLARVYLGELDAGMERLQQGLALAREIQNRYSELNVLAYQAEGLIFLGRWDEAAATLAEAQALAASTGQEDLNPKLDRLAGLLAALPAAHRSATWRFGARAGAGADGVPVDRLRHLTALLGTLGASTDLDDVLNQGLGALVELAGAERGLLQLYDGYRISRRLTLGLGPEEDDTFSTTLVRDVLWSGEPAFIEDLEAHGELAQQASVQALALRSAMALPLLAEGEVIGVMLADSRQLGCWRAADLELARALAAAVALAVTQARTHRADAEESAALALLNRFWQTAWGLTSPEALGEVALKLGLELTGADAGSLLAPDGTALAAVGRARVSGSICAWVHEQREPLHMVDVQDEEAFNSARSVMALGLRTVYAVPVGGAGVLYFDRQRMEEAAPGVMPTLARLGDALAEALR
ncbi:MAG: two component, sigma54 specific, transcriptional regulator, Fis family, partial [Cyanobacteria bacterium RYN_339]|nr:two component, sigma54 specific, transcriptional regulator, Fis family [Cyanobacteria bacterium RYN_339]